MLLFVADSKKDFNTINMRKLFFSLFFVFTICLACTSANSSDILFETDRGWVSNPLHPFHSTSCDSTSNPFVLQLKTRGTFIGSVIKSFPLYQMKKSDLNVDFTIQYKTENCKSSSIIVATFNEIYELLNTDTIILPQVADWTDLNGRFSASGASYLSLMIEASGVSDTSLGCVDIRKFAVSADGAPLPEWKYEGETRMLTKEHVLPYSSMLKEDVMDAKVLALGETVHGTDTYFEMFVDIAKERVLNHHCKSILIELPFDVTLAINRFIKNDSNYSLSDIEESLSVYLFSDSLNSLLLWLKEYNASHNNEVSFYGLDTPMSNMLMVINLHDFISNANVKKSASVDSLCSKILENRRRPEKILGLLENNIEVRGVLTEEEIGVICKGLSCMKEVVPIELYGHRDNNMAEMFNFVTNQRLSPLSTATIYMNLGHVWYGGYRDKLAYVLVPQMSPMGRRLKSLLGDDYKCLALTAMKGQARTFEKGEKTQLSDLYEAPENSIEYQMASVMKGDSYLLTSNLSGEDRFCMRDLGNQVLDRQFLVPIPLKRVVDGIVFTETVSGLKKKVCDFSEFAMNKVTETIIPKNKK